MYIFQRSLYNLSLSIFEKARLDLMQRKCDLDVPENQYILRMMVRSPETNGFVIPDELAWISPTLANICQFHDMVFHDRPYVYVTVRSGEVKSVTDDEWHVDGFSMRVPHKPEQNYIWSDCYPTEVLDQRFVIPEDFDPFKHNIHTYFQDNADPSKIKSLKERHLCIIDPYVVHRRPQVPVGTKRAFVRISFVPIEIEDDTCTPNLLLKKKIYNRIDIRKSLVPYINTKETV